MLPFEFSLLLLINFLPFSNSIFDYPELLNSLNPSLNPCDDFYTFVCDGFHKNVKLRSECTEISNSATRKLLVQSQLEAILSGNIPQQILSTNQNGQIANLYRKIFGFHQACMEWPGKEMQMGNEVVLGKLEELTKGGGMAFGGPWRRQFDTEWAIKAFPIGAFFQLVALIDTRKGRTNSSRKIVGIRPKSLISSQADWNSNGKSNTQLMSSRFGQIMHVLLEDDIWRALRRNRPPVLFPFTNYILQGEVNPNCLRVNCPMSDLLIRMLFAEAERRVRNLLVVEQKLATNFDTDPLYDHGPLAHQSYIKLRQINIHLPSFNFTAFLGAIFAPIGLPINGDTEIHVSEPGMLQRLAVVLGQLSGQQIADYLDWQTVWAFLPQMDNRYTRPYVNVNKMKDSLSVRKCPMERRWMQMGEKCEKFLEWYFPHLVDRLYIQRHMGRGVREEVKQIYGNVYAAFRTMLENNSWLDFGTKQHALAKLGSVQANAVYFDQIFNDQYLANLYRQYQAFRLDIPFAQMVHQIEGLNFLRHFFSADYYDPSWGVNAYYSRENNALIVLNGYLHSPIFSPNFSVPLNYAGIGTVLGHELSHGFDDWGSYFNGEGINEDWLGPSMRRVFHEKKQCFVEQYDQIKVNVEGANLLINGTLTVNENIADNGGLVAAYRAWKSIGQTNSAEKLRGLEQFDADQLFFIHYAFRQCSQMGQIWLRQRLMVGQHAVVPARVNIPLQNLPQFAATFKCPLGSPMNPLKKCALW